MSVCDEIISLLRERGQSLAIAESLTGGLVASKFTQIAGASDVFIGGVVAYQNAVKSELLGVSTSLLETEGAVCASVADQMAVGVKNTMADACGIPRERVFGLSTTGVAGPGAQGTHPAGEVYIAVSLPDGPAVNRHLRLSGNRDQVREDAANELIELLREQITA